MKQYTTIKIDKNSHHYPSLLSVIPNPPKVLYCRGNLNLLNTNCIAIVGSRAATEYGKWSAYNQARRIAECGVTVVSGMAEGIDSKAHEGALDAGGNTIAVLGNGVDICYPKRNRKLYQRILENGLIISEYPDEMKAMRHTFPERNRIISGLSLLTVVAEAGLKSGSLITANLAQDQGREVFAIPGNVNRKTSFGCNKLIADNANIIVTFDDVLTYLNIELVNDESKYDGLSDIEKRIIEKISNNGEATVDMLSNDLNMEIPQMSGIVTVLEMKGLVQTAFGKIFIEN